MEFEGIVDLGELKEQTSREEKGNWENMEVYGGGGEEAGSQQAQQRQRRGIFMRDNVALARYFFLEIQSKVFPSLKNHSPNLSCETLSGDIAIKSSLNYPQTLWLNFD